MRARSFWLILEVVLAFAIPVYYWILILFTMPLWLWMMGSASSDSIWMIASSFAGIPAIISVIGLLTAAIEREPVSLPKFSVLAFLACCGILGFWSTITVQFETLDLEPHMLIGALAPTACALHLLVLCARLIGPPTDSSAH